MEQRCCASCPDTRRSRQLIGGIAAQGDEVRNLRRIDAVARADLSRTDPRQFTPSDGVKDGGAIRGELKRVTVPARNEDSAAAFFLRLRRRGKKIIRLEARRLRILKSASSDEFWDAVQLLKQRLVEIASTLVGGKFLMPVGRDVQRVPRD